MMDSVDKYGSCGIPWWQGETLKSSSYEEQIQKFKDALVPVVNAICDELVPAFAVCVDSIIQLFDDILKTYPDRRVVWLAFCHKKEKVRKKNRNRLVKYYAKAVKRDDHS